MIIGWAVSSQETLTSRALLAEATGESERLKDTEKDSTRQLEDEGTTSQGSRELGPSTSRKWILPRTWRKLDTEPGVKSPAPSAVFGFYFEIVADSQDFQRQYGESRAPFSQLPPW